MRHSPIQTTDADVQAQADRRTAALASVAVVLGLIVVGLWLVHALAKTSRIEDCLMAGRTNCERIATNGH
jgi:hypothetical protein